MSGYHVGGVVTYVLLSFLLIGQTQAQGDYEDYDLMPGEVSDLGKTPLDIVFVIDTSTFTNLTLNLEEKVKEFMTSFINDADVDSGAVKVALVTYSTHPNLVFNLNDFSTKEDIINEIFGADFAEGERNTADVLSVVRNLLIRGRSMVPKVVLLLQTGQSDRNRDRTLQEADALKYARANIFVVGFKMDDSAIEEAKSIASRPVSENTLFIDSEAEFDFAKDLVFAQIFIRAAQTLNSPAAGSERLDVVFLVHFSNTMKKQTFDDIISFMKSVLEYAAIDDDKVRVSAVLYRKHATTLFDFNSFPKDAVLDKIDQISYNYRFRPSSPGVGFKHIREHLLTGQLTGNRQEVPDLVILVTDAITDTDVSAAMDAAQQLKAKGATLFTVGINITYPGDLVGWATKPEFTILVNDSKYLASQTIMLQDEFVGLRGEDDPLPLVFPKFETTTTTPAPTTTTTTTTTTTAPFSNDGNSDTADIVFLIHASKKTTTKDFKKYLLTYLGNLSMRPDNKKVKYAVVTYGKDAETIFSLQEFSKKKMTKKAFRKVPKNKRFKVADLTEALKYVRTSVFTPENGDDPNNPNGIILISNQASKKVKFDQLQAEVDALNQDGVSIFAVGVGNDPVLQHEMEIVTGGSENPQTLMIDNFESMIKSPVLTKALARSMRIFHLEEMDIVFAIHAGHKSKVKDVKNYLQSFIKDIISNLDVDSGAVRVGLAVYGTDTNVQFDLNAYKKSKKLQKAVKKLKPKLLRSKGSNVVDMLSKVQTEMFIDSKGDRPDVANLLVIVTDEKSNADISLLEQQSSTLKNAGTKVLAIGLKDADDSEIEILSSQPKSEYFFTSKNYADLTKSESLKDQLNRIPIFKNFKTSDKSTGKKKKKPKTTIPPVVAGSTQASTKPQITTEKPKRTKRPKSTKSPKRTKAPPITSTSTTRTTTGMVTTPLVTVPTTEFRKIPEETTVLPTVDLTDGPIYVVPKIPLSDSGQADIVIALHMSQRARPSHTRNVQAFLKELISNADVASGNVQIGMLMYSADPEIVFRLNQHQDLEEMKKEIDGLQPIPSDTVDSSSAVYQVVNMLNPYFNRREDVPAAAIFVTDEPSTDNLELLEPALRDAAREGISIFSVGIGMRDRSELDQLASDPANAVSVLRYGQVRGETAGLHQKIKALRKMEETTTTTQATTTEILTTDRVSLADWMKACGLSKTDLVFILDASTSVTEANFQKMRDFLKEFLRNADIDSGSVRVGVNIYSTDVQIKFHLNDYTTEREIYDAIDQIPYIYGSTNTADALQWMAKRMFIPSKGDRPDAPNIAILLTDGISNINSRRTIAEAESARDDDGILIYVIGIGLQDTREVEGIASKPISKNLFSIQSFDELKGLDQKIFSNVCPEETPDSPPTADAGKDVYLQLPDSSVRLSGDRSNDDKGIVKYTWTQIRGPRVRVTPTDDQYLDLNGLKEGEYEFELEVEDAAGQKDTDIVEINVIPELDLPPIADAGPDKTIQLPDDSVALSGASSTDDKGIVDYSWELTSPRNRRISLRGENSMNVDVNNLEEGEYTFTLTVRDKKGQSTSDSATVYVKAAKDLPPVANAGRDYDIQLPTDTIRLDGSSSTDDIGIVDYDWSIISGDARGVALGSVDPSRVTLDGLKEGKYVVQLRVTDKKGQTSTDTATINVGRAVRTSGYDVIFILDSSVSPSYFRWMKNYARNVIREMSIDDEEFRVGFMIYSNGAYRQFDLNEYNTKSDVFSAVDAVGYRPGGKSTAEAFKFVRNQMFTKRNGDRDYAKNYIIHLTGGADSRDQFAAATEACRIQNGGTGMFAVGLGEVPNTDELDAYSSLSTSDYRMLMRSENEMGEMPGLMLYQLKNGSPRPSPCPIEVTTTRKPGVCVAQGDIVFILDSSGSVGQDNFYRVLNFTYNIIDQLDIDNGDFRVGSETFSDASRLDFNLNEFTTKTDLKAALTKVEVVYMYGNTHTAHALRRARTEMFTMEAGDRPEVPNIAVIVTDGQSNVNHELTIPEANSLKASGASIITVAVGFTSETSELDGITSPPTSDNLYYVTDYKSLEKVKAKLIDTLCSDSNLCRNNPCQNGGTCHDGVRSFHCRCPPEYFGETCDKRCGEPADVVIVLDSSDTVGRYNFGRLKEYAEHLVRQMNKDSCNINLGFMKYSSAAMVQVSLGMHSDTETNIRALDQISYSRGRANMAAALRALRTRMFNGGRGDRPDAKNVAYFLTDGTNDVMADRTEPEAELTISSGVRIIPIGVNLRERYELDNIAHNQGINVIEIDDEPGLIENTDVILRPLYQGNDFCAEKPCSNGGLCISEPFGYKCDCPVGYTGDTCQKRCSAKGDVVFAVDTSRYVTRSELKKVRRFLRSIVKRMSFKRKQFSVGMVQFTDWAKVILDFHEGQSKKAVRSSIAGLRVHGGDPEPATALAKANYRIFNAAGASRDKPDYLVLITKSMRNEVDILNEASKLKLQGTQVLGVGIGLSDDEKEYMQSAVSLPAAETAIFADDVKTLNDIADQIVEFMCDEDNVCAKSPCQNGGTCKRHGGDYYCECTVGYAGRHCESRCQARADIVFLLDSSGSVGHEDFRRVKQFVHNMVSDLQIGKEKTRVGLTTYSSNTRHGFYMSKYFDLFKLQSAIAGINYEYGNTNTAAGLKLVRERYFGDRHGNRPEIQDFLVVITDGVSNVDPDQTLVEAQLLKDMGVHVYAVGIGQFDPFEINGIASEPASKNAFILKDYSDLKGISSSIIKATCRDPTVCDANPCQNGGLCVPGINGPFCECRAGFRGVHCEDSCVVVKDIFFLVDSSDSVGANNFKTALNFVSNIVEEFSSKDSHNRFSLITFGSEVQIVFSLGRYTSLPILKNAITNARYRPGNTNTAGALRTALEISSRSLGDRYDAENIIFMLVDGNGNVNENDTLVAAEDLKNGGARIITLAINMQDYSEVSQMASGEQDVFRVNTYNSLPSILEDIILTTCKNGNEILG